MSQVNTIPTNSWDFWQLWTTSGVWSWGQIVKSVQKNLFYEHCRWTLLNFIFWASPEWSTHGEVAKVHQKNSIKNQYSILFWRCDPWSPPPLFSPPFFSEGLIPLFKHLISTATAWGKGHRMVLGSTCRWTMHKWNTHIIHTETALKIAI